MHLGISVEVRVGKSPLLIMFSLELSSNALLEMSPNPSLTFKLMVLKQAQGK